MVLITDVPNSWMVDNVPLQTKAYNISTWGGNRQSPLPMRGSNIVVPYRPGQQWTRKVPDARTISLEMWVVGMLTNGRVPSGSMREMFEANYRWLRQHLWTPGRQIELSKFIEVDGIQQKVTALAEFAGGLDLEMQGPLRGTFSVELLLADPYFYGPEYTVESPGYTVIAGDAPTHHVRVDFPGSGTLQQNETEIYLTNLSQSSLTANVETGEVTGGAGVHPGLLLCRGSKLWFPLRPGPITLQGPGTVHYNPAYL